MKYDIENVPPTAAQIELQQQRAEEKREFLILYTAGIWAVWFVSLSLMLTFIYSMDAFGDFSTTRLTVAGAATCLHMVACFFLSSYLEDKKTAANFESLSHDFLNDQAVQMAVFFNWCEQDEKVGRYYAMVNDQGRKPTYGEYLAIKKRFIENQKGQNTEIQKKDDSRSLLLSGRPNTDNDPATFVQDPITQL